MTRSLLLGDLSGWQAWIGRYAGHRAEYSHRLPSVRGELLHGWTHTRDMHIYTVNATEMTAIGEWNLKEGLEANETVKHK